VVPAPGRQFTGLTHRDVHLSLLEHAQFAIEFDLDQTAAVEQRKAAMADAASKGYLVGAAHISFPGIGRVAARGESYDWLPVNYSEQALRGTGGKR
jgi:hypothetical protein